MTIVNDLASPLAGLRSKVTERKAVVGVVGLGYVGLPLLVAAASSGFKVVGFDIDQSKTRKIQNGDSYIDAVKPAAIRQALRKGKLEATHNMGRLGECDVICICVPTPLTRQREPDLKFVKSTAAAIARTLRRGQLVILESTSYPGTTEDIVRPILDRTGLTCGSDFFLAYSPEREDPGNKNFNTVTIPKIVSGDGEHALLVASAFYASLVQKIVPVQNVRTAEVVKLTENIFRAVNIGLVNELKVIYEAMGIDVWQVIEAAKTKPFGYMPFYPGPGLGGHCIPVDPFYLTWKSREYSLPTRFIELAGEINASMPSHVVQRLSSELDKRLGLAMSNAAVLVVGVAYKKNVNDTRESPALKILELLQGSVADLAYHDPHVPVMKLTRNHPQFASMKSIDLNVDSISHYDAVVVVTDHDAIDYHMIGRHARLIVDTRNALGFRGISSRYLCKA